MCAEGSELQIISLRREWSRSSALCLCDWMRDGTRSSSIFQTLLGEPMAATTLRPWEWLSTRTAVSEESISQIGFTQNNNFLLNLNYFYQFKNNNDLVFFIYFYNSYSNSNRLFIQNILKVKYGIISCLVSFVSSFFPVVARVLAHSLSVDQPLLFVLYVIEAAWRTTRVPCYVILNAAKFILFLDMFDQQILYNWQLILKIELSEFSTSLETKALLYLINDRLALRHKLMKIINLFFISFYELSIFSDQFLLFRSSASLR